MRVLIPRPEREAAALAPALGQRGHLAVIAPLLRLDIVRPPSDFAAALASAQAVLLTSANGARALAEASEQRSKRGPAGGETPAAPPPGAGLPHVTPAAAATAAPAQLGQPRPDPPA